MMPSARTTVRLDDELLAQLKAQARRENVSLTRLLNRTLRAGMQAARARPAKRRAYREQPHAMGLPRLVPDKALAVAAALGDEEVVRELPLSK